MIWPHVRRRATRSGATGTPGRANGREDEQAEDRREHEERHRRVAEQEDERLRALRDAAAEQVGGPRPEDAARRERRSPGRASAATTRSGASTGPSCSGPVGPLKNAAWSSPQRPSNAIHGNALFAAAGSLGIVCTTGPQLAMRADRVVAADARVGRAAEVERRRELVRVRAGGRVDDGMGPVDDLELLVAPGGPLGALVRAVSDLGRILRRAPRPRRRRRRRAGSSPSRPRACC